jgi:hypothetical protein
MISDFLLFYQTVAQLCFTVLGLWILVLQTKYRDWSVKPVRRRMATNISLYFLLPGCMSLLALLSVHTTLLWQGAFIVAGVLGMIETALLARDEGRLLAHTADAHSQRVQSLRTLRWLGIALYAFVVLVALFAGLIRQLVAPLNIAGVLITLLVVLGLVLAWVYFVEPMDEGE